jgi:hypothetical protein
MRQAFGAFKASHASFRAGAIALAASQAVACAAVERAFDPVMADTHIDELRVAAEEKTALETRLAALSSENDELKSRLGDLEKKLSQSQRAVALRDAQIAALPKPAAPKPEPKPAAATQKPASTAPADPVVAAANADAALPEAGAAVDAAPRLVQPTFSSAETTFENEAQGDIKVASVLWGVHLASYRRAEEASAGWRKLQREYPDELGLLEPRIEKVSVADKGIFLRLVGGGFSSREKANALCASLSSKGVFCRVANFGGDRLSTTDDAS